MFLTMGFLASGNIILFWSKAIKMRKEILLPLIPVSIFSFNVN